LKAVVVGYGSIGARHARILGGLGCQVAIATRREIDLTARFATLDEAMARFDPGLVVVANETSLHEQTVRELAGGGYRGMVVVEKPLGRAPFPGPDHGFRNAGVAYNLRFHPIIERLKQQAGQSPALSVWAYVGQYLPLWRPGTDYRQSYSTSRARGGGVLRDLSHEVDYLAYVFGSWVDVSALGGHLSDLAGDSEDMACLIARQERSAATGLQLNYLDRAGRRQVVCNMGDHTIAADLVAGTFTIDQIAEPLSVERDETYRRMWSAVLAGDFTQMCSFAEAQATLTFIAAVERSIETYSWVKL
jgi:predicted dehydrogenase